MESSSIKKNINRKKRALRVRQRLRGNESKPRLCVFRTNRHIFVQLINDEISKTLASTSTIVEKSNVR